MDILTFILTTIVAYFGLLVGSLVANNSPDEVHSFKKYLPFLQLVVFVLIFVLLFVYLPFWIALVLLLFSFIFIYVFWHKKNHNLLDYILLGALFAITSIDVQLHLYMVLLVFLFGLFTGALHFALHTVYKDKKHDVGFHKHSGSHLSFGILSKKLFVDYGFFMLIAISSYFMAHIINFLFFI